jgi:hypothetical protein
MADTKIVLVQMIDICRPQKFSISIQYIKLYSSHYGIPIAWELRRSNNGMNLNRDELTSWWYGTSWKDVKLLEKNSEIVDIFISSWYVLYQSNICTASKIVHLLQYLGRPGAVACLLQPSSFDVLPYSTRLVFQILNQTYLFCQEVLSKVYDNLQSPISA